MKTTRRNLFRIFAIAGIFTQLRFPWSPVPAASHLPKPKKPNPLPEEIAHLWMGVLQLKVTYGDKNVSWYLTTAYPSQRVALGVFVHLPKSKRTVGAIFGQHHMASMVFRALVEGIDSVGRKIVVMA